MMKSISTSDVLNGLLVVSLVVLVIVMVVVLLTKSVKQQFKDDLSSLIITDDNNALVKMACWWNQKVKPPPASTPGKETFTDGKPSPSPPPPSPPPPSPPSPSFYDCAGSFARDMNWDTTKGYERSFPECNVKKTRAGRNYCCNILEQTARCMNKKTVKNMPTGLVNSAEVLCPASVDASNVFITIAKAGGEPIVALLSTLMNALPIPGNAPYIAPSGISSVNCSRDDLERFKFNLSMSPTDIAILYDDNKAIIHYVYDNKAPKKCFQSFMDIIRVLYATKKDTGNFLSSLKGAVQDFMHCLKDSKLTEEEIYYLSKLIRAVLKGIVKDELSKLSVELVPELPRLIESEIEKMIHTLICKIHPKGCKPKP